MSPGSGIKILSGAVWHLPVWTLRLVVLSFALSSTMAFADDDGHDDDNTQSDGNGGDTAVSSPEISTGAGITGLMVACGGLLLAADRVRRPTVLESRSPV